MFERKTAAARPRTDEARRARQHLADAGYFLREAISQIGLMPTSPRNDALGEKAREIEESIVELERRI
jgi:hypothetical protein